MTAWHETYRGVVKPWECDVVEHFTIAYYFDRFADATRNFLDHIGDGHRLDVALHNGPARRHVTFREELRAGAGFHIVTAVTGIDSGIGSGTLQLGHQVVNSASGNTITWVAETLALAPSIPAAARERLSSLAVAWPGPKPPDRPAPRVEHALLTLRDRVKPGEIDEDGNLSLADHVHRFSAANMQAMAAVGITAAYMKEQRRGYSTFELDFTQVGRAKVSDTIDVSTAVAHLGTSSLRFVHRMTGPGGREIATMVQSGVHLDMDARRSTAMPESLRASIAKLLIKDA
jgi:acyl-CoA thioesterase FadM